MTDDAGLHKRITACRVCAVSPPAGPRPIIQSSGGADILIIGQAPGAKAHARGIPWQDDSGARLREWMGIEAVDFYHPTKVALMPMGFCYPGKKEAGICRRARNARRCGTPRCWRACRAAD